MILDSNLISLTYIQLPERVLDHPIAHGMHLRRLIDLLSN
jgi:hypothetical protein